MEVSAANVGELERLNSKELVLREFLKFSWGVSRGASQGSEAEGRSLIERMVQSGRITFDQGQKLLATLMSRMNQSREVFEARVDLGVRKTVEKLEAAVSKEMMNVSERMAALEGRLEKVTTKLGK